jgi:hypothetical protein
MQDDALALDAWRRVRRLYTVVNHSHSPSIDTKQRLYLIGSEAGYGDDAIGPLGGEPRLVSEPGAKLRCRVLAGEDEQVVKGAHHRCW